MGGCGSKPKVAGDRPLQPWQTSDGVSLAESYFEQTRSLRQRERQSLNRVLLNSRVEHDNAADGRAAVRSGSGRSTSEVESEIVVSSQNAALAQCNATLSRTSGTSVHSRSVSASRPSAAESAARREARLRQRQRREEEELAFALALSASEAQAVAEAMAEPIDVKDARAIALAQAELDSAAPGTLSFVAAEPPAQAHAPVAEAAAPAAAVPPELSQPTAEGVSPPAVGQSLRERYIAVPVEQPGSRNEAHRLGQHRSQRHASVRRTRSAPSSTSRPSVADAYSSSSESSRVSRRSTQPAILELIEESGVEEHVVSTPELAPTALLKQQETEAGQLKSACAWSQSSLDSAFDLHSAEPRVHKQRSLPKPRAFMMT